MPEYRTYFMMESENKTFYGENSLNFEGLP